MIPSTATTVTATTSDRAPVVSLAPEPAAISHDEYLDALAAGFEQADPDFPLLLEGQSLRTGDGGRWYLVRDGETWTAVPWLAAEATRLDAFMRATADDE